MTTEAWQGAFIAVTILAAGVAAVMAVRRIGEWWAALPPRVKPQAASRERLSRLFVVWLAALGVWGLTAAVGHYAPRDGLYGEMLFGLPELVGMLTFASRLAWGLLCAAAADTVLWPRFSMSAILWPNTGGLWHTTPVPLRAVALALWGMLYLVIAGGAIAAIEAVVSGGGGD